MESLYFNGYIWELARGNMLLMKEVNVAFEDNPEDLHPSPRHRKVIEEYIYPSYQEECLEIAKEWELGKVSVLDEKAGPVISFLMDSLCSPFDAFLLSYCYKKMKVLVGIYNRMKIMQVKEPIKILAEISVFSEKEIIDFTEKWDAIEEARMKMLEEVRRDIEKYQKKKIGQSLLDKEEEH